MKPIRIIPRLDIKGPNLVKGIHLEGLRVLGKPEDFAYQYYLDGADELIYIDVVASLYMRNNLLDVVRRTAEKIFIPLTVGGGIRSIEDIRQVLRSGADKVAINTAAIKNPNLITEGAKTFGSQCIVVSIEAKKKGSIYEAYVDNGRESTGLDVFEWARQACERGAGELLITSVDREGTGKGYDIELIERITASVDIPVIACGGAGNAEHFYEAIHNGKADAVSAGSAFHYCQSRNMVTEKIFKDEGNIEYLKNRVAINPAGTARFSPLSISEVKRHLSEKAIVCRDDMRRFCKHVSKEPKRYNQTVVIIDYELGNLFSVQMILNHLGAQVEITNDKDKIARADKLILPGVGTFGDGMARLRAKGLVEPIKEHVNSGKPLLGICLGMQLLMSEGEEFGVHKGLDIVKGRVVRLKESIPKDSHYKIPHIGWNKLLFPAKYRNSMERGSPWEGTILGNLTEDVFMYFVHSNVVVPNDPSCCLSEAEYGSNIFCSVLRQGNIYGCQFHPERSGRDGMEIYRQFVFDTNSNSFNTHLERKTNVR